MTSNCDQRRQSYHMPLRENQVEWQGRLNTKSDEVAYAKHKHWIKVYAERSFLNPCLMKYVFQCQDDFNFKSAHEGILTRLQPNEPVVIPIYCDHVNNVSYEFRAVFEAHACSF